MKKGIPWEERAWKPVVGMKIRYRKKSRVGKGYDPEVVATIIGVHNDRTIEVQRNNGARRNVFLREKTWSEAWEPVPDEKPTVMSANNGITEADVRRIVREEVKAAMDIIGEAFGNSASYILAHPDD